MTIVTIWTQTMKKGGSLSEKTRNRRRRTFLDHRKALNELDRTVLNSSITIASHQSMISRFIQRHGSLEGKW
jgi:menaquinone-dependent protoporphyrinogen IX oxidase